MADPMTREQLDAYVQLAENIRERFGDNWQIVDDEDADEVSVRTEDSTPVFFTELFATSQTSGDDPLEVAGFLAAAIDYVPRMAAMIRQAEAELTGAYQGAEELRGMYRDLKDSATEIERQRDQLTTEQATVFAALAEALGHRPATLGQAVARIITALADAHAACTTAEGQRDDYRTAHKTAVDQVTRLKERVAELAELEAGIKHLTAADGSIDMSLTLAHDLMRIYVASFIEILDAANAPNFVELMFKLAGSTDRYTVTIRRPGGETPGEVLGKVRAERDQLRALLREFVQDTPCDPHPGNGYCQSHGEKAPCPHAEAKALLGLDGTEAGT